MTTLSFSLLLVWSYWENSLHTSTWTIMHGMAIPLQLLLRLQSTYTLHVLLTWIMVLFYFSTRASPFIGSLWQRDSQIYIKILDLSIIWGTCLLLITSLLYYISNIYVYISTILTMQQWYSYIEDISILHMLMHKHTLDYILASFPSGLLK